MSFAKSLHPFLLRKYVTTVGEKYSMALLTTSGHQFANFPFVCYATDVTFQQTNVPLGSYAEKKTYFSGKHSQYGHKVEVSVLPNGFAINCTAHYKGSVSDKAIFDDNLEFHVSALSKQATEDRIADHGDEGTNQWAVIADKGYQGIQRVVRAVLPKKKPAGGILTLDDIRSNDRIASDRVIVENFFGRMKTLWAVCGETYRWSRDNYDVLFQTCMALTNVHIRLHPLRADDGKVYSQYINRMALIGSKKDKGKKTSARTYRTKRKARLTLMLAAESSLVAGSAVGGSDSDLGSNSDAEYGSNLLF
ncbi:hypothetical protein H257_09107 [Aphanomyces astaci]|uniref:DDE Tnp4 domain-containing protein n=2 Tax=Aphanomyces astaci TaxID=112090 RepID=W4GC30_APHAT|nr:hypothetical protein H257_09107 [Aphanomyces astaci]ETV77220.1 hypothetical protein H257_09107 [Aphanomyces astaci]|eukprot:XP_009833526.1 hypothetical protein H257_09107 [Aphanomyces astaci]